MFESDKQTQHPSRDNHQKRVERVGRTQSGKVYLIGGGTIILLLIAAAIVYPLLLARPRASLHKTNMMVGSTRESTAPTITPVPTSTPSGHPVSINVVNGVAYLGAYDQAIYALRASDSKLLWRFKTTGSADFKPLIMNGVVYSATYVGEMSGFVYALRASDGKLLWQYKTDGGPYLYIDNGKVYVTSRTSLIVLQADSGRLLWRYTPPGTLDSLWGQLFAGTVYLNAHRIDDPNTTTTYALGANDGKLLWNYQAKYSSNVVLVERGIVYLSEQGTPLTQTQAAGPGSFTAMQATTGHVLWRQPVDGDPSIARVIDSTIYLTVAKPSLEPPPPDAAPRNALWSIHPLLPDIPQKSALSSAYALRVNDGKPLWHVSLNNGKPCWANWLILNNGILYVGMTGFNSANNDNSSAINALHSQDGSLAWKRGYSGSLSDVSVQHDIIYFSSGSTSNSTIYALRLSDASQLWSRPIAIYAGFYAPLLIGTMLYIGSDNATAYALDARSGAPRWQYSVAIS